MTDKSKWACALAVSLATIIALVLSLAMSNPRRLYGFDTLLLSAARRVFVPLIATILVVAIVCVIFRARDVFHRIAPRMAQIVVWIPPLFLLLWQLSAWAVLPACLLGAALVAPLHLPFIRGFPASFVAASLVQAGTVLWMVDREVKAALVLALGSILLNLLIRNRRPPQSPPVKDWTRAAVAVCASLLLTIAGLLPMIMGGGGDSSAGNGANPGTPPKSKQDPGTQGHRVPSAEEMLAETHRGILLFPEEERVVRLVPPLPAMGHGLKKMSKTEPLSIPFYGVYWMFREPYKEPPPGSFVVRGEPDLKSFRSADLAPLKMEAHQNFGKLIDADCCRKIKVAIRSADRYPTTVSMELILVNTTLPNKPSLSLGRAAVTSTPLWRPGPLPLTVLEVLEFDVPQEPPLQQFDKITVIFHRGLIRSYRSARIAIERFILQPR